MDAVTYPDDKVVAFINERIVPLRAEAEGPFAGEFRITWTPTVVTLDFYGREHHRTVGFLAPEELLPSLLIGMAKIDFDVNQYNDAILPLDELLSRYADSAAAPEATYLRGVCRYKSSHQAGPLKEAYEQLQAHYPKSEWALRAAPYRLL